MAIALSVIDWVFMVIILVFVVLALLKGFVNELFGKASWIVGIICAIFFYSKVALILNGKIANMIVCNILAFILIFIVSFLVLRIVGTIIHKVFTLSILRGLDKALGAMFGLIEGFAIVCFIMFIMTIQPFVDCYELLSDSFFYSIMNTYIPQVKSAIANV